MNYEQKYKEALAWVESIYPELNHEHQMKAETFFPELAESEDERVREDILAFVKREGQHIDKYKWHKWIDWLKNIPYTIDHEKREGFQLGYKAGLEKQVQKSIDWLKLFKQRIGG